MQMNITWLRCWMICFQQNADFKVYCEALKNGDATTRQELEDRFCAIAELHADWGDINLVNAKSNSQSFVTWAKERHNLFYKPTLIGWIEDPKAYVHSPGRLLLDVPLADRKSETLTQLRKFIDFAYLVREKAVMESTKPAARLVNLPLPMPKYALHGELNRATRNRVRKAIYVDSYRHKRNLENGKALSITDTVLAIKQDPKNPLGWKMTCQDADAHRRNAFKKHLFAESGSEVTLIKRHRKDFEALVRNTVQGRFPDFS